MDTIEQRVTAERSRLQMRDDMIAGMMEQYPLNTALDRYCAEGLTLQEAVVRARNEVRSWLMQCFDSFARDWP